MDGKFDIGRIGENIATNELLSRGYLVTHLDKGTRGVSANADLLVGHPSAYGHALIQVRSTNAKVGMTHVFVGSVPEDVITGKRPMYNSKAGFNADFVAYLTIKSTREYRLLMVPVIDAEWIVVDHARRWNAQETRHGTQRAPVNTLWLPIDQADLKRATDASRTLANETAGRLTVYENRYDGLLNYLSSKDRQPAGIENTK